jgi:hypothetical protein
MLTKTLAKEWSIEILTNLPYHGLLPQYNIYYPNMGFGECRRCLRPEWDVKESVKQTNDLHEFPRMQASQGVAESCENNGLRLARKLSRLNSQITELSAVFSSQLRHGRVSKIRIEIAEAPYVVPKVGFMRTSWFEYNLRWRIWWLSLIIVNYLEGAYLNTVTAWQGRYQWKWRNMEARAEGRIGLKRL